MLPAPLQIPLVAGDSFDGQTGGPPLRIAVLKAAGPVSSVSELGNRLEGQHAVRTAAVGNYLKVGRQIDHASLEVGQRGTVKSTWVPA